MSIIEKLKSRRAIKVYVAFLILCVSGIVCDRVVLPWYINLGGVVKVPNVVGLDYNKAVELLKGVNLSPIEAGKRFDHTYPEGAVIFQSPMPNMNVREGRRIYLTISSGDEYVEVPDLIGKGVKEAKILLLNAGLRMGMISYDSTDTSGGEQIIRQSVPRNSKVQPESFVGVTLPKPPSEGNCAVPNLINKSLTEAEKYLIQNKFAVGKIIYVYRTDLNPNTVVDQYPRAGDLVEEGKEINLWVVDEPSNKNHLPEN
jgi:eukaryotic-like serine/threonine-protein kinase